MTDDHTTKDHTCDGWCDIHEFELTEGYPCYVCRWVEAERDRIIALLEKLKGPEKACCDLCQPHADKGSHYLTNVIALIKGENE